MRKVAIFGATSAIAMEAAKCFAERGDALCLVARDREKLEGVRRDLVIRGAQRVEVEVSDLLDGVLQRPLFERCVEKMEGLDVLLLAWGTLGVQKRDEGDPESVAREISNNFTSPAMLLTVAANYFEGKRDGVIAAITSVAGDRGRKSNYIYGSAKGALALFLQGLRNRLASSGVTVVTIKPGFVDTPMTAAFKKGPLFAKPQAVGRGVFNAINDRKDIVYLPWFWRYILLVIRHIPEAIFKRLSI